MTHPPTAPPATPPAVPAVAPPAPPPPAPAPPQPPRRTAWAEGFARLRAGSRTEPGRLRIIGALLAGLLLLFGAVTAWEVGDRGAAASALIDTSHPLSADAAAIYRSLADANTTAAEGFLSGGSEPRPVRELYEKHIRTAAELLSAAAANSAGSAEAQRHIAVLTEHLPVYTGLVETARTNNRQGLPLGGAYLRYADEQMQQVLLPAAEALYELERERFQQDLSRARAWPWAALAAGVLALGALGWAQRRHYLRTNRVFNQGLLAATAAAGVLLLWLAGAHAAAAGSLGTAEREGARSLHVLNEAWTGALKAHGDEYLTLVARGAGQEFAESFREHMRRVAGPEEKPAGLLGDALALADHEAGRAPVERAIDRTAQWRERHAAAMAAEAAGDYDTAVLRVIGAEDSSRESFDQVTESLAEAVGQEERQFERAAGRGRSALTGLAAGAGALALLAAAGAVLGIGRRLAEYR